MSNGSGLIGGNSATQTLIVPKPGDCSKYYIFHSGDHVTGNVGARYSVVDMCLNGGLGDVMSSSKNIQILTNCSEKWTAVKHTNGTDIWIICHEFGNANYRIFLLTSAGLSSSTVQSIGSVHSTNCGVGYMKASHSGNKIVTATSFNCSNLDLFNFNPSTGVLSSYVDLGSTLGTNWYYGIEFSPNDQILYLSDIYVTSSVFQVNLSNYNMVTLATNGANYEYGGMQLGPDGKIYIARTGQNFVSCISTPNVVGTGCGFVNNALTLSPGTNCQLGLINFVPWAMTSTLPQFVSLGSDTALNCTAPITLTVNSACNSTYLWSNNSTNNSITVSTTGNYWVEVSNVCGVGRDTIQVNGSSINVAAQFTTSGNASCGIPFSFTNTSTGATSYSWNFGDNSTSSSVNPSHTYLSPGVYQVMLISSGTCGTDTVYQFITVNPTVTTAAFTTSGSVCGSPVSFVNTSNNGVTYYWSFGDNTSSTANSPTHVYTSPGTYQIMLIATSPCDADTSYGLVTINAGSVTAAFSSISNACVGNPIFFSNTSSGATSSTWNFGDASGSSATSPVHTYSTPGTFTVTLIANGSCASDTISNIVTISPVPTATISGNDTICSGQSVVLSGSGGSTYLWSGGSSGVSSTLTVSPSVTTAYYLQVGNGSCLSALDTHIVVVVPPSNLSIAGPTSICTGQTVSLIASGGINYQWSGGSSSTAGTIVVSPTASTTYYLNTNSQCPAVPDTHTIVVLPQPIVNASGNTNICAGQSTTLTATGGTSYQWSGGSSDTTASITVAPIATTTYFVTTSNGYCTSGFDTITVTVLPSPTVSIVGPSAVCLGTQVTLSVVGTATAFVWGGGASGNGSTVTDVPTSATNYWVVGYNSLGCSDTAFATVSVYDAQSPAILGDDTICVGESSQLICAGNGTYSWSPAGTLSNSTIQNPVASPTVTTTYTVQLIDVNGCSGTDAFTLVVDACTGITEQSNESFTPQLYPNPSSDQVYVSANSEIITRIELRSVTGSLVKVVDDLNNSTGEILDVSNFENGVYFVFVYTTDNVGAAELLILK
jgi:PKD repeat protein